MKTYNCIAFTVFEHTKLYPFQNLAWGLFLKYSSTFANVSLDILVKYILIEKKVWSFKNLYSVLVYKCALVEVR